MLELLVDEPIFIGFKASTSLRLLLDSLGSADKKYVSSEDSTFLRLCRIGDDLYVGKLIHEALTTDRVDDIRRNILSILRKLGPVVPLPSTLRILACRPTDGAHAPTADRQTSAPEEPPFIRAIR
ncbi:MAG: hypothetical protein ACRD5D_00320 [Candidatus Polarisedimenticolia bacterium]